VGAFLVGYDCGVISTILSDRRWIDLMKPAENCTLSFIGVSLLKLTRHRGGYRRHFLRV
jgi:hypothetical protein